MTLLWPAGTLRLSCEFMELSAPRYSQTPFPAYRFVPGRHPHPTAHPEGHSYHGPKHAEPEVAYYPPEQWRCSEDYLYGCDLYNHGYWWEAHEAWEGLWQLTDKSGVQGRFLQSLIQASARHLKLYTQKLRGIESLGISSTQHMQFVLERLESPVYMGLDFKAWTTQVDDYYQAALARNPQKPTHNYSRYPYVILNV